MKISKTGFVLTPIALGLIAFNNALGASGLIDGFNAAYYKEFKCGNGNWYTTFSVPKYNNTNLQSDKGVCVFNYGNGYTVFIADLRVASVEFGADKKSEKNYIVNGKQVLEPLYGLKSITDWKKISNAEAIVNGQFFDFKSPSTLSFPMKNYGSSIMAHGVDMRGEDNSNFRTLMFYGYGSAMVKTFNPKDLYSNNRLIVGFKPNYSNSSRGQAPNSSKARTFVGVRFVRNGLVHSHLAIFVVSKNSKVSDMLKVFEQWGVNQNDVVMFDGGGSTQYSYKKATHSTGRSIPMVFKLIGNWVFT